MQTWKTRFNELLAKQVTALKEVKQVDTKQDWIHATSKVKQSMDELYAFFNTYNEHGSPNHENEMPDN